MSLVELDPRLNAYRDDLADSRLEGRVSAKRFVDGREAVVAAPAAPLRGEPHPQAPVTATLLLGETVRIFDEDGEGWSWVQSDWDNYVGYAPSAVFGQIETEPTHVVSALFAHLYPAPNIKIPPIGGAPLSARIAIEAGVEPQNQFYPLRHGRWIHEEHIRPVDALETDWVAVAESFLGVAYLWGGETMEGIDCSGLVQVALHACGRKCPRDSDMQLADLGAPIEADGDLRRGDLIFWKGHVGVMQDAQRLLHANASNMLCVSEPLAEARRRIAKSGFGDVFGARRLPF